MKPVLPIAVVLLSSLAACAPRPDDISAADVGDNQYRSFSCSQLAEAETKYSQALANLSADQNRAATGDAWGVFLLGLPLSSMSGADKETKIAITKGHLQSIDREQQRENC
ncbi:hypothetical protein [Roseovarius sp. E0-M6]|uniref:hypothetical protein n=1 Tax=Roseovarius sp. E0-M6 TaxID=3127118 RepID=UPI0030102D84